MNKLPRWTPRTWWTGLFAITLGAEIGVLLTDAVGSGAWIGAQVTAGLLLAALVHHLRMPSWSAPAFWTLVVGLGTLGEVIVSRLAGALGADRAVVAVAITTTALFGGWRIGVGPAPVEEVPPGPEESGWWLLALGATTLGVALGIPTSEAVVERAVVLGGLVGLVVGMRGRSAALGFWIAVVMSSALGVGLRATVQAAFEALGAFPAAPATVAVLGAGMLLGAFRRPRSPKGSA